MIFLPKYLCVSYFIITFVVETRNQQLRNSKIQESMKQVILTMNVNGQPFSQQASLAACLRRVATTANQGGMVSNVTIKAWRA